MNEQIVDVTINKVNPSDIQNNPQNNPQIDPQIDSQINQPLYIPDENNTDFYLSLLNQFKRVKYDEKEFLRYSQYIVREYIINSHGRGLLCYWGMGFGKTPLAVSITEYYRINDPNRNIIFLSAKSLAGNFRKSLTEYMLDIEKIPQSEIESLINENYKFISSNSSNMFKHIQNLNKSEEDLLYEKKLGEITSNYNKDKSLENSLVIVDEAHNLFNSISNGSKNAMGFYDLVMRTKDIKLIFLTGTPAVNDPFELVSCFNMLKGKLYDQPKSNKFANNKYSNNKKRTDPFELPDPEPEPKPESTEPESSNNESDDAEGGGFDEYDFDNPKTYGGKNDYTLFPENREDFENWFIDFDTLSIKNQDIFQARLSGLVSYYGPVYFDKNDGVHREFFPKELPTIIKIIPMSTDQYGSYAMARDKERNEATKPTFSKQAERFSANKKSNSTYRVESRQLSNFKFPKHALGVPQGIKMPEKLLNNLTENDLSDEGLANNSPKMLQAYKDITEFFNNGQRLGIFYSSFVISGIKVFSKILEHRGWKLYNSNIVINEAADTEMENKIETLMNDDEIKAGGRYRKNRSKTKKGGAVTYKFAIISGEIKPEERSEIVRIFNTPENAHGGIIDLLLITSTGVEGLDLKGLRFGIMLEPYWHDARRGQFAARMIRYKSHEHLPENERNCQLVIYLSDYPEKIASIASQEEKTTDVDLYDESIISKIILDKAFLMLIESSIDCNIHHGTLDPIIQRKIKCLLCKPTNQKLFNSNIRHDFEQDRPCQPFVVDSNVRSITAKEIDIDGKKFFYTYDNDKGIDSLIIYEFNQNLNGHIPIRSNNPYYPIIMEKLLEFLIK